VRRRKKMRGITTAIRTQETTFEGEKLQDGDVSDLIIDQAQSWHDLRRAVHDPSLFLGKVRCRTPGMEGLDMAEYGRVKLSEPAMWSAGCIEALVEMVRSLGRFGEVATEVGGGWRRDGRRTGVVRQGGEYVKRLQ
jgi:hypothetical protein